MIKPGGRPSAIPGVFSTYLKGDLLTVLEACMIFDLKGTAAHRSAISQKSNITPEDWTPFILSYCIKKVASSCGWRNQKRGARGQLPFSESGMTGEIREQATPRGG